MNHKYGEFSQTQMAESKRKIRSSIFFLLLIVDPKTRNQYEGIDVNQAFTDIMLKLNGMNSLLFYPTELVEVMSLLEAALIQYNAPEFNTEDFQHSAYRKLILDAGAKVIAIKEV